MREPKLDMAAIGQVESVFALSNGHIGLRGNLDEGEPHATPGTYLNSFYEKRPLPYAEGGYGYPESGQTIINVTNGKLIRLLVEDEPFDLRYGELRHHERVLDLQAGTLTREVEWASPAGRAVRVAQRAHGVAHPTGDRRHPLRGRGRSTAPALLVVQSELVANEQLPARAEADPRVEAALTDPLLSEQHGTHDNGAVADPPDPPVGPAGGRRDGPRDRGPREAEASPPRPPRTSAAPRRSPACSRARR